MSLDNSDADGDCFIIVNRIFKKQMHSSGQSLIQMSLTSAIKKKSLLGTDYFMQCREIVSVVRMHHNHTFFVWKTKITFVCEIQQLLCFVSKVSPGQASPACRMALKTLPAWTGQDPPG